MIDAVPTHRGRVSRRPAAPAATKSGHRAGHDAILLAAATEARAGDRVVDLGAGVGAAGLALARRVAGIDLVLVEIDAVLAGLARANAAANAIDADVIVLDVEADAAGLCGRRLWPDSVDARADEPALQRSSAAPRLAGHRRAHRACGDRDDALDLGACGAAHPAIRRDALTLIWRADGIADVLAALITVSAAWQVLPVHGEARGPAIRVLVRAIKGGRAPTRSSRASCSMMSQACPIKGCRKFWPRGACRWRTREDRPHARFRARTLLRKRLRLLFRRRVKSIAVKRLPMSIISR